MLVKCFLMYAESFAFSRKLLPTLKSYSTEGLCVGFFTKHASTKFLNSGDHGELGSLGGKSCRIRVTTFAAGNLA